MKFRVFRTSCHSDDHAVSPCLGATQEIDAKGEVGWFLTVKDLDALLGLSKDVGEIIVTVRTGATIEIYDDYRE